MVLLPPNQGLDRIMHSGLSRQGSYLDFINQIILRVRANIPHTQILNLVLHPREAHLSNTIREMEYANVVVIEDFIEALPNCELVIIFGSALFRLFHGLCIPTLNWDVYKYNYVKTFPINGSTFLTVNDFEESTEWISEVLSSGVQANTLNYDRLPSVRDFIKVSQ